MAKLFLRDTSVESCADGSSGFDMDPTQGSPTADVSASVNSATFTEVLTWDETVGTNGKSGDYDLSVDVSTLSTDAEFRFRLQRLNAACAVQESSAYGPTFNTVGIETATITFSPAWAANDVLRLSLELRRSGGHGSRSISVSTQDPDSFTDEPADPNVTILAVAAQATADVLAPAIKAGATVAAALAAAAAQALLPTIKIAKTVAPPAASATAHAPSPTIAAIQNVTVAAQPAQAAADTLLPTIAAGIAIVAALAQAAAGAPPPAVLAQSGGIVILAALATATATGHEPAIGGYLDLTATLTLVASLSAALTATATASPSATLAAADAPSATIERI